MWLVHLVLLKTSEMYVGFLQSPGSCNCFSRSAISCQDLLRTTHPLLRKDSLEIWHQTVLMRPQPLRSHRKQLRFVCLETRSTACQSAGTSPPSLDGRQGQPAVLLTLALFLQQCLARFECAACHKASACCPAMVSVSYPKKCLTWTAFAKPASLLLLHLRFKLLLEDPRPWTSNCTRPMPEDSETLIQRPVFC